MIALCALRSTPRQGEGRQDTCGTRGGGELDGERRRCRLCCRYAHRAKTSCAGDCCVLENPIAAYPTSGWEHVQNSQPLILEKKLTNSGPLRKSTGKHSIYTRGHSLDDARQYSDFAAGSRRQRKWRACRAHAAVLARQHPLQ
jgi:hypothetical protein